MVHGEIVLVFLEDDANLFPLRSLRIGNETNETTYRYSLQYSTYALESSFQWHDAVAYCKFPTVRMIASGELAPSAFAPLAVQSDAYTCGCDAAPAMQMCQEDFVRRKEPQVLLECKRDWRTERACENDRVVWHSNNLKSEDITQTLGASEWFDWSELISDRISAINWNMAPHKRTGVAFSIGDFALWLEAIEQWSQRLI